MFLTKWGKTKFSNQCQFILLPTLCYSKLLICVTKIQFLNQHPINTQAWQRLLYGCQTKMHAIPAWNKNWRLGHLVLYSIVIILSLRQWVSLFMIGTSKTLYILSDDTTIARWRSHRMDYSQIDHILLLLMQDQIYPLVTVGNYCNTKWPHIPQT